MFNFVGRVIGCLASSLLAGWPAVAATAAAAPTTHCEALASVILPGIDLKVDRVRAVPPGPAPAVAYAPPIDGPLPAYCRIDARFESRTGHDGHAYAIRIALALPEKWNGRFLFQGGGGLNGTVNEPLGWLAAGSVPALARGFAVVSTDSGHEGAVFDARFMADQQAALNFLYQSVGKVNTVARALLTRYYGRGPAHSYFAGCSTGGREAMLMSQRYPEQFDGIIAGAPAMRTGRSNLALRWAHAALNAIAPRDAQGQRLAGAALGETERALLMKSLLAACDAKDGLSDGLIFARCDFDPAVLSCAAGQQANCLSAAQVAAVKRAFAGPVDAAGLAAYPGYPYDGGINDSGPHGIPGFLLGAPGPVEQPGGATSVDVDAERAAADNGIAALGDTASWTNLSSFAAHGGKLIFFHGLSDPWFSAYDTTAYYERLSADNGGADAVHGFSRLFLVPGMGHCGGGAATLDRFDLLSALVDWVEHGEAPERVTATGSDYPGRSRPLCAYPAHAHYRGNGDSNDQSSFDCQRE